MSSSARTAPSDRPGDTSAARDRERIRERNPRGEGDRLRIELLEAAAELMVEKGDLDAISLRSIAARAGVSPTAVYRHFDDHVSLLREAVAYCWSEFGLALAAADGEVTDPYERLRASGRAYVAFALEQRGMYQVLFSNKVDVGFDVGSKGDVGQSPFDHLVGMVRGILDDRGDDRDPHFVAVQIHTWVHGIVDLIGRHPRGEWPPVEDLLAELQPRLDLVPPS